jgi:hypothetical protein
VCCAVADWLTGIGCLDSDHAPLAPRVKKTEPPLELNSPSCQPASIRSSIAATKTRLRWLSAGECSYFKQRIAHFYREVHFEAADILLMFRLPRSLGPQIAPTGRKSRLRSSRAA